MHTVINHPLVRHLVTLLRDRDTPPRLFRENVARITTLLAYEALRDLPTTSRKVVTPVAQTRGDVLAERLVIVPVIRAGIAMTDSVLDLLPDAVVGFLGMQRNGDEAAPTAYYSKVPPCRANETAVLLDPMLATGRTVCDAVAQLKQLGYRKIRFINVIASEAGLARLEREHPDVFTYTAAVDAKLNESFYIVPGLGDAGDRIYSTTANSALSRLMRALESKILADGRVDMAEAGELLRISKSIAAMDDDIFCFKTELENVRADGLVDPIESDRIAKMLSALADKADGHSVAICADCGRPISLRTFQDGVSMCPWCGRTLSH